MHKKFHTPWVQHSLNGSKSPVLPSLFWNVLLYHVSSITTWARLAFGAGISETLGEPSTPYSRSSWVLGQMMCWCHLMKRGKYSSWQSHFSTRICSSKWSYFYKWWSPVRRFQSASERAYTQCGDMFALQTANGVHEAHVKMCMREYARLRYEIPPLVHHSWLASVTHLYSSPVLLDNFFRAGQQQKEEEAAAASQSLNKFQNQLFPLGEYTFALERAWTYTFACWNAHYGLTLRVCEFV